MFKKGQYVVVAGSTLTAENKTSEYHFELAKVLEVAKFELIVAPLKSTFGRPYRAKKVSCFPLSVTQVETHAVVRKPKIGDFVMYYNVGYDKITKKMGLLMGIVERPGSRTQGKLLCGNKYEDVPFEDLLILEENNYKS